MVVIYFRQLNLWARRWKRFASHFKSPPSPELVPSHSLSFATFALQYSSVEGFNLGPLTGPLIEKNNKKL